MSGPKGKGRHVSIDDKDLEKQREDLNNGNTKKSNNKCEKVFIAYLQERWSDKVPHYEYWDYEKATLDKIVSKFWFEVCQKNEDRYTVASLKHMRYAINRNLKKRGHKTDLLKSDCYTGSQEAFEDAKKLLKKLGYGFVKHYEEIKPSGKFKTYIFLQITKAHVRIKSKQMSHPISNKCHLSLTT